MQKRSAEYQPPEGVETEAEPGSRGRVLRNNLGIQREQERELATVGTLFSAVKEGHLMRCDGLTGFFVGALERGLASDV